MAIWVLGKINFFECLLIGWDLNEIHGECGFQEGLWWWAFVGEIQEKPQETVCPPDQGDLHKVIKLVVRFCYQRFDYLQTRQNQHWEPLPDMQGRILGLGLQVLNLLVTCKKKLWFPFHVLEMWSCCNTSSTLTLVKPSQQPRQTFARKSSGC